MRKRMAERNCLAKIRKGRLARVLLLSVLISLACSTIVAAATVRLTSMDVEWNLQYTDTKWRLTNDTGVDVNYTWSAYGGALTDSGTIGPEYTTAARWTNPYYIYVPAPHPVTLVVVCTWEGGGYARLVKASSGNVLPPPPQPQLLRPYRDGLVVKLGRVVPLKWQYVDASGAVVDISTPVPVVSVYGPDGALVDLEGPGASTEFYDADTWAWQLNWQTKGLEPGLYDIYITSDSESLYAGTIELR